MNEKQRPQDSLLNTIFEFISRVVYLNVLWILGTLAGGIIFGLYPATFSVFKLTHIWIKDPEKPVTLVTQFKIFYRQSFKTANQYGLLLTTLLGLSWLDLMFAYQNYFLSDALSWFGVLFTMVALLFTYISFAMWIYVPITVVYFPNFTFLESIKFALVSVLGTPLLTLKLLLILILSILVFSVFISITLFLGFSLPIYLWMKMAHKKYRTFFIVGETEHELFVNVKYITDKTSLIRFINEDEDSIPPLNDIEFIAQTFDHPHFNDILSTVILNRASETLSGFILAQTHEDTVQIQWFWISPKRPLEILSMKLFEIFLAQAKAQGMTRLEVQFPKNFTDYPFHWQKTFFVSQGFNKNAESILIYNMQKEEP
jgi:uncharacterized membrane protein YesL